jgi:hypothetical protein
VIFSFTLPAGQLVKTGPRYQYSDPSAKSSPGGGIALFKILKRGSLSSGIRIRLYTDLSSATEAEMRTDVTVGSVSWAIQGAWAQKPNGWFLSDVAIGH